MLGMESPQGTFRGLKPKFWPIIFVKAPWIVGGERKIMIEPQGCPPLFS